MRGTLFLFGLILITIGVVGPNLSLGIIGDQMPYSANELNDICKSKLGEIGRGISSGIREDCTFVSTLNGTFMAMLIIGIGIIIYAIISPHPVSVDGAVTNERKTYVKTGSKTITCPVCGHIIDLSGEMKKLFKACPNCKSLIELVYE